MSQRPFSLHIAMRSLAQSPSSPVACGTDGQSLLQKYNRGEALGVSDGTQRWSRTFEGKESSRERNRRFLFCASLALTLLALGGCGTQTLRFVLTFDTTDAARRTELLEAGKRVIERRLSRWEEVDPKKWTAEEQLDGSTLVEIPVGSREARKTVEGEVLKSFDLAIMTLSTEEKGDLYVEEQGWFNATGIMQNHITWTESAVDQDSRGVVHLIFSPDGLELLTQVYHEHPKGTLGLFVRGRLMSKLTIETPEPTGEIIISGIPIPNLAAIFSDDVNVGTHVTFSLP